MAPLASPQSDQINGVVDNSPPVDTSHSLNGSSSGNLKQSPNGPSHENSKESSVESLRRTSKTSQKGPQKKAQNDSLETPSEKDSTKSPGEPSGESTGKPAEESQSNSQSNSQNNSRSSSPNGSPKESPSTSPSPSPPSSPRSSTSNPSAAASAAASSGSNSGFKKGHRRAASSVADSPLQQVNTEIAPHFKLKVVSVYERLFNEEPHAPGYWIEFFLLPINKKELAGIIRANAPLSQHEETIQTLVSAAIANLGPQLPTDIIVNALGVLEVVFSETLDLSSKTPTSSIVQVVAGIDRSSVVFDELTANVLALLRHKTLKVVQAATHCVWTISRKTFGTPLSTLFATKNFFAAFIQVIDKYTNQDVSTQAFAAIGVLTALNVYDDEGASIYLQRISDYVDEAVMTKIIALTQRELSNNPNLGSSASNGSTASTSNGGGITGWFSSWFSSPPPESSSSDLGDETNNMETKDTSPQTLDHVILALHLFVVHNTIFAQTFASSSALITLITSAASVFENAQKSVQCHGETWLVLLLLRRLVDTDFLALVDPAAASTIKIEAPKLALDTSRRVPLAGILDLTQIGLRAMGSSKKPDAQLFEQLAVMINQACSQMIITKTIWQYNWPHFWKTVMGLIKHLSSKSSSENVVKSLLNTLVGMSLHRDVLDEEDWTYLIYSIVQNAAFFNTTIEAFPNLNEAASVRAANAMIAQYELKHDSPDLPTVLKQGKMAVGRISTLVGEKQRPFSTLSEPVIKRIVKSLIK